MHCNLRLSDVAPVALDFNYEARAPAYKINNSARNQWAFISVFGYFLLNMRRNFRAFGKILTPLLDFIRDDRDYSTAIGERLPCDLDL